MYVTGKKSAFKFELRNDLNIEDIPILAEKIILAICGCYFQLIYYEISSHLTRGEEFDLFISLTINSMIRKYSYGNPIVTHTSIYINLPRSTLK